MDPRVFRVRPVPRGCVFEVRTEPFQLPGRNVLPEMCEAAAEGTWGSPADLCCPLAMGPIVHESLGVDGVRGLAAGRRDCPGDVEDG